MTIVKNLAAALAATAQRLADTLAQIQQDQPLADAYAQAVIYGMFVGQLRGQPLPLMLKSLPPFDWVHDFTRLLHDHRIRPIIAEIDQILQSSPMDGIKQHFGKSIHGKSMHTDDAAIHFYEHFLAAYHPDQRKVLGVFYTPLPIVRYMIRAVDDLLRQEFHLKDGLADHSQTIADEQPIHRVHILDPAMGTGTFLAETAKHICGHICGDHIPHRTKAHRTKTAWNDNAARNLLPRLHGVEVLMTPFLTAHLQFAALFQDSGIALPMNHYADFHLDNALEMNLQEIPVMVVLGNPPYNVSTMNKGEQAKKLIEPYKANLGETKTNLDDDYIKFIALGQRLIEQNAGQSGIMAYITNNSFLEGITHRRMRQSLLETFHQIYVLNLHGNARKKETAPDGSKDENVFNIKQGTSINVFIRTSAKKRGTPCQVFYADLYGKRSAKFHFLETRRLSTTSFIKIEPAANNYFFVPKNLSSENEYTSGFSVSELFVLYNSGIKTDRDSLFIDDDKKRLEHRIRMLLSGRYDESFRKTYRIHDSHSYKITRRIQGKFFDPSCLRRITYRPFDEKWIYFDPAIISRAGARVMQHMITGRMMTSNVALLTSRLIPANHVFNRVFVTKILADGHSVSDQTYVFPLYTYNSLGQQHLNLNEKIVDQIACSIGKKPNGMDVFDYVYGVLHDDLYRTAYKELLNTDFPRVPFPKHAAMFDENVLRGARLRTLHLFEEVPDILTTFPVEGNNIIEHVRWKDSDVYINETQYFGNVPHSVWEGEVGAYMPAQKYLKDRKGRTLTLEERQHYQQMIAVLVEERLR